jgi:hypothetical protein
VSFHLLKNDQITEYQNPISESRILGITGFHGLWVAFLPCRDEMLRVFSPAGFPLIIYPINQKNHKNHISDRKCTLKLLAYFVFTALFFLHFMFNRRWTNLIFIQFGVPFGTNFFDFIKIKEI